MKRDMPDYTEFRTLSPTAYADALGRKQFMDIGIKEIWPHIPRIAGPAYTVRCPPGDNLMLHAAIYRAPAGSVIVVEAGSIDYAVSGGNVCGIAQKRQIAGFVIDGVIRDVAEVREAQFPVFARGVIPIPGVKQALGTLSEPVHCGGVHVHPQDIVVADEEGIAVIPGADQASIYEIAYQRTIKDASQSLEEWEAAHKAKIARILLEQGFIEN